MLLLLLKGIVLWVRILHRQSTDYAEYTAQPSYISVICVLWMALEVL